MEAEINNNIVDRKAMIEQNISYAYRLALRFYGKRSHTQAEIEDLVSSAYLGLCDAAARYDENKSDAFKTYSYFRILGTMYDYMQQSGGYSRNIYKKLVGEDRLDLEMLKASSVEDLETLKTLIEDWGITIHVNRKSSGVELTYANNKSQDEEFASKQISSAIATAMDRLDPVSRRIIQGRYFEDLSLSDISKEFPELSKTFICRAHQRALSQLRVLLTLKTHNQ